MKTYSFDEILNESGPQVRDAIENRYRELLASFPLSALRVDCGLSQSDVAGVLDISQAAVSKMESRSDMLLSTVYRYVEALRGEVRVSVSIDDREYLIQPSKSRSASFFLQKEKHVSPAASFRPQKSLESGAAHGGPYRGLWNMLSAPKSDEINDSHYGMACANDSLYAGPMAA